MTTPAYFRAQAERCQRVAGSTHSRELADLMLKAAAEYLRLAEDAEKVPSSEPTPQHGEQPTTQQQQIQSDTEKKD